MGTDRGSEVPTHCRRFFDIKLFKHSAQGEGTSASRFYPS